MENKANVNSCLSYWSKFYETKWIIHINICSLFYLKISYYYITVHYTLIYVRTLQPNELTLCESYWFMDLVIYFSHICLPMNVPHVWVCMVYICNKVFYTIRSVSVEMFFFCYKIFWWRQSTRKLHTNSCGSYVLSINHDNYTVHPCNTL